jgi:uncharacterized protein involved in exopolysaccharide biosynthesis
MVGAAAIGLSASALGIKNPGDMYVGELKSTTIADNIIKKFDLAKLYDKDYPEDVRKKLAHYVTIQNDKKSGIISIEVIDEDPKRAADMANAFVTELKELNKDMSSSDAQERKAFFDARLTEVKASLAQAEQDMKGFQEKSGIIKLDAQATAAIEGISVLKAQIASQEVEMKVMRTYATAKNPDIKRAEQAVQGMRAQLAQLEAKSDRASAIVPTGNIPSAGMEYLKKLRELKFNEALYELLLKQYEAAKLDEGKNPIAMQVVDYAKPPVKKSSPKRVLITIIAFILGLCGSCSAAMFMEYKGKLMSNPVNAERISVIRHRLSLKKISA